MTNQISNPRLEFLATAPPGLESIVASELQLMGIKKTQIVPGGVIFTGSNRTLVRANLRLKVAGRILVKIASFPSKHLSALYKSALQLSYDTYIKTGSAVDIRVSATCKKSTLYHSKACAERVAKAIFEKQNLKKMPQFVDGAPLKEGGPLGIQVRIKRDKVKISADSSGPHLHLRGYRSHTTEAPLRETLAAATLLYCGYTGDEPLVDPMCGSGTFLIEAAHIASGTPVGANRHFSFLNWPNFDKKIYKSEKRKALGEIRPIRGPIWGFDQNEKAVSAAAANIDATSFKKQISVKQQPLSKLVLPGPSGLLICNPPYGKRLGNISKLKNLYAQIGNTIKHNPGWRLGLVTDNPTLADACGLQFVKKVGPIPHGGIRITLYCT